MAKAIKNIIPPPVVEPKVEVVLTLSKEEAETLLAILGRVGGSPVTSRRKYAQSIFYALGDLSLNYNSAGEPDLRAVGSLWFADRIDMQ